MFNRKSVIGSIFLGSIFVFVLSTGCDEFLASLFPVPTTDNNVEETEPALYVNLQIDAEREDVEGITKIVDELKKRNIKTTIYVTADYANQQALLIYDFYSQGFEIALHGFNTGEQLASMTYDEQYDLLSRGKTALEGCQPCGTYKPISGFRPQYFSQNEDTYKILDELGLKYNCGFKVGQIYTEGHENDTAPYLVEGHEFSAVPVTTVEYNGEEVYLCDIACANVQEMTGSQWGELLEASYQQALQNQEPLIILFHGWYTGDDTQYDYWQPFVDFLDKIQDQAGFVTTQELVDMYSSN